MNTWLYFRVGAILLVAIAGCFVPLGAHAAPPIDWDALFIIFGACAIGLPLVLGVQRFNPQSAKVWSRPSWMANPLNFRDPIQFFHFGAYLSIAQGLVVLIRMVLTSVPFYVEALVPLAMGLGILLGIRITLGLFASKFASSGQG